MRRKRIFAKNVTLPLFYSSEINCLLMKSDDHIQDVTGGPIKNQRFGKKKITNSIQQI